MVLEPDRFEFESKPNHLLAVWPYLHLQAHVLVFRAMEGPKGVITHARPDVGHAES